MEEEEEIPFNNGEPFKVHLLHRDPDSKERNQVKKVEDDYVYLSKLPYRERKFKSVKKERIVLVNKHNNRTGTTEVEEKVEKYW